MAIGYWPLGKPKNQKIKASLDNILWPLAFGETKVKY